MVATEEKILDIKVEYKDAINKIADYKAQLDALKLSEKGYKEELKAGNITQEEYNKNITAAKVAAKEYRTAINVLEKQITSQIKTQKSNADILAEVEDLMGTNVRSIAEAEAANKALREAVRSLSDEEESAYAIRQKLNAQIDNNTDYIRRNSDEYIKQKMNVGAYTESIKQAFVEIKNGGLTMQSVGIIAKGFSDLVGKQMVRGFNDLRHAGTKTAGTIRLVTAALLSIPIVAIVAALASLAAAFTRTQKGMETFQRISSMIGAAIDVILDRIAMLGGAVVKVFQGDFDGAMKAAKGAITGIGEEIKEEVAQAEKLRIELQKIEKQEIELNIQRSKHRAEIERLKQIAEDTTKSEQERLKAAKEAYAIEQGDMQKQIQLQEKRIANMLGYVEVTKEVRDVIKGLNDGTLKADEAIGMIGLSESTLSDFQELADEVVKLNEQKESSLTRQIELNNKINSIQKEADEVTKEGIEELENKIKEESKLKEEEFQKEYERQTKLAETRLASQEAWSQEELELKKKLNELRLEEELRQYADDEEMKLAIKAKYIAANEALDESYNKHKLEEDEARAQKEIAIEEEKQRAMRAVADNLIGLMEEIGDSNRAAAIASKVLALAQIAIDTGKAISAGVAEAVKIGFPQNLGAIATTVAAVLANMTSAIKTVKGAKFATGGDVSGAGTATSDSIPAMLSNGESVMTAAATSMFAPILSAFNQAGGGVPIYGQQTGNQAMGEDMLARAFAKGVESLPSPVVSVEEINNVGNRVKVIDNISSI